MKTEILKVGLVFKNYKELCAELGMEVKKANSKRAQMKELACYCKFHNEGQKIFIDEVYDKPMEKVENRGKQSIYGNLVQLLITDLLAQSGGHISISKNKLMLSIGMVNCNYGEGKELVKNLSTYTNIEEKVIYDFYNTSSSSFRSVVETALNSLMDKRVIMYDTTIKVSEKDKFSTRVATKLEKQIIMGIERLVMEEMGYNEISSLRVSKHWGEFKRKTKQMIQEETNINYYFSAYDIVISEKYIIEERNKLINLLLEQVQRQESKNELNQLVYTQLLLNAQKRHEKAFTSKKMGKIRKSDTYIKNFEQLANLLIDKNAKNITNAIRNIKVTEELPIDLLNECEALFG